MAQDKKKLEGILTYHYRFTFPDGAVKDFEPRLNDKTLTLIMDREQKCPEWAELRNFKCSNCTLDEAKHKYCPVAMSLMDLIGSFGGSNSYEEVDVLIETGARKYAKHTTLQQGLSSLIGIYMVSCGCPNGYRSSNHGPR